MRRSPPFAGVAALALALLACGTAPPSPAEPAQAPPPRSPPEPAPIAVAPAPAETPDETFRYRPPLVEALQAWTPPAVAEVRLPGGGRALLLERHGLPVVSIRVSLRLEERAAIPGLDAVVIETLLESPGPDGGPSARAALAAMGAQVAFDGEWDTVGIDLTVSASVAGEAIAAAIAGFRADPKQEALDRVRTRLSAATERTASREKVDTPHTRSFRALVELLPADHRYREAAATPDDLRRPRLADVSRRRAQLASADRLRVAASGDLTQDALRAALETATRGWRSAPGPAPRSKLARGVILVESEGATTAQVIVALPELDARWALWPFLDRAVRDAVFPWMNREIKSAWRDGEVATFEIRDLDLAYVTVTVMPAEAARVAAGLLDLLDHAGQWDFPEETLASVRRSNVRWLEGFYASDAEVLRWLSWTVAMDLPADHRARIHDARLRAGPAEVLAAARTRFKREDARVIVGGAQPGGASVMGGLGLGKPVRVRSRKSGGGRAVGVRP